MTSLRILLLVALPAILLSACSFGFGVSRTAYLREPGAIDTVRQRVDLATYEAKYGKHDGVFLNSEVTVEPFIEGMKGYVAKVRRLRYLVLNPQAEWLSTFNVETGPTEELTDVVILVTSPEGRTTVYQRDALTALESGDESVSYKLAYPDIRKGSVVEESYEIIDQPESNPSNDYALQFSVPCEKFSFTYLCPNHWGTQVKRLGPGRYLDYTRAAPYSGREKAVLRYEASDIPAYEWEPYSPFFKEHGEYLQFMINSTMFTRQSTWEDLGRGFVQYAIDKESYWSRALENTVEEATRDARTQRDTAEAIVGWVQANMEVGEGSLEDDFVDVLDRREGNIYMVNGLARAMLEEAGVNSEMLLVHSARDGFFDDTYVSMDQLYIPAVTAVIGSTTYTVFPWMRNMPVGLVPEHLKGQQAMRIGREGFAGFTTVIENDSSSTTNDDVYDLVIDDEGVIHVTEEKTLRGIQAYRIRESLDELKKEEIDAEVKEMLTYSEGDVKMESYEILDREDYRKPLVIRMKYTIDNLVTVTPDEVIFQTGGLFSPSINGKWKVDSDERRNPIRIYHDERLNKSVRIAHPKGWTLATELPSVDYSNALGSISGRSTVSPGQITVEHVRTLKRADEPREKADDLLAVVGRRSKLSIPTLLFRVDPQTASGD